MNAFKFSAVALALAASISASAMTSIQDADLAQVSGQEGVSIVADLNVNIGSFIYTDSGASVSFNNIDIKGMMIATIDVLTYPYFKSALDGAVAAQAPALLPWDVPGLAFAMIVAAGYSGQDVVQFAFPVVGVTSAVTANARLATPTITIASMTTGNGGASMGGLQIKNLDLQGTHVWMFGH